MLYKDIYIDSIIKTESFFRPFDKRLIEYTTIILIYIFGGNYKKFTLGVSQVSFQYWLDRYRAGFWITLFKTMNLENNREMVLYFANLKEISFTDEKEFLIAYNGKPSKAYVEKFRHFMLFSAKKFHEIQS